MVEFALVATVFFFPLVFGFIELGRSVVAKTAVTAAAREGVRFAIVHGAEASVVADSAMIADYVIGRTKLSPIAVKTTWAPNNSYPSTATVQVTYQYVPLVPVLPPRTMVSQSKQTIAF